MCYHYPREQWRSPWGIFALCAETPFIFCSLKEKKLWKISPSAQLQPGCTIPGLNTTTAASARSWISRDARATGRWTTRCKSWSIWNTGQARTPREKPATALAFCYRSAISFLLKQPRPRASRWARSGNTASACSSSRRKSCSAIRQRSCLRSSARRRGCPSLAGGRCRYAPSIWGRRHGTVCPASGRRLWESRREWPLVSPLTGGCMWFAGCSSSPVRRPTCAACPAAPSCIRACFWSRSCGSSTRICRTRTTRPPSAWSTAAFPPTPLPAGTGRTPTGSFSTTARSTPSGEMWTPCSPVRRPLPAAF